MARYRSREAETEDVNQRRLQRGAVERRHLTRWSVGHDELAPGVIDHTHLDPSVVEIIREVGGTSGIGQMLLLSATDIDIDDEGYVEFDTIVHQHGFDDVLVAGESILWPVSAVGGAIVTFAWDTFAGGGTIELEVDGTVPAWGTIASGGSGSEGRGEIGVDIADGSIVRLKVTHGEVTPQTATVTLCLKMEDPAASPSAPEPPAAPGLVDTVWLDAQVHSVATATYIQSSVPLDVGVAYTIVVTGNYNVFGATSLSPVHVPVMFPSGGASDAALDAEVWFADASGGGSRPTHSAEFKIDIGDGAGFVHPEPVGGPFTTIQTGHVYTYSIASGVGLPLKAAISDNPIGDNNGKLKIEIYR